MPGREKRKQQLRDHIDDVESKIVDMDKRMLKAEGDLETYYQEALVKLKEVRSLADVQLERLHEAGEEAWDDLKDEVDDAIDRLRSNLNSLMSRFSDDGPVEPEFRKTTNGGSDKRSTPKAKARKKI